jgi:CRP-like cAMP-binding protein
MFDGLKTRLVKLEEGDYLFREGERSEDIYVIETGRLSVEKRGKSIALLTENQIVGEMAFMDASPRSASVKALEATRVIALDVASFKAHLRLQPTWFRILMKSLLGKLRDSSEKISAKG